MKQSVILFLMVLIYGTSSAALSTDTIRQPMDSVDSVHPMDSVGKGQTLDELLVRSYNSSYKLTKGGVLVDVAGTPLSETGTCFDLLAQLPGMRSDEGSIEVFGKGVPQIYINGRKMIDASELHRLTSSEIRNVEVISNPGAKYGAEVGAVILIRTVRKRGDGLSGSVQATGRLARYFSQAENVAFNYRRGGLDVFASGNLDCARLYQKQSNTMSIAADEGLYNVISKIGIYPKNTTCLANFGVNWEINANHSLGLRYEYSMPLYGKSYWNTDEQVHLNDNYLSKIEYDTHWDTHRLPTNSLNFYYSGKIKAVKLNISNDFYSRHNRTIQLIEERDFLPVNHINPFRGTFRVAERDEAKIIRSDNKVVSSLFASKGVGEWEFKGNSFEFGYEVTSTDRRDSFIHDSGGEAWLPDADDRIRETTCAGFLSASVPVGKVEFSAGLRYEHTVSDYYQNGVLMPLQSRKYSRWYPNFDFTFPIGKANFTFYYTAKTKRPLYSQLSSGIRYDDRFLYEVGNPLLVSEMIHDFALAGVYRWVYFNVRYQYGKNAILGVIEPFEEGSSPVNMMSYRNFHHLSKYSATLSLSPKIGIWSPRARLNLMGQVLTIPSMGRMVGMHSMVQEFGRTSVAGERSMCNPLLFWSLYNSLTLKKGLTLTFDITGRTRGDMDVVTLKPSWQINLGVTKALKSWHLQLQATDIFKTARNSMISYGSSMTLDKWNYSDTRSLRLIIRYTFNTASSKYKGKTAGQSERQRL